MVEVWGRVARRVVRRQHLCDSGRAHRTWIQSGGQRGDLRTGTPGACPILPSGSPSPDDRNVLEAEGRRFLGQHFGLAVIARHDWLNDQTSFETPLYLRARQGRRPICRGVCWLRLGPEARRAGTALDGLRVTGLQAGIVEHGRVAASRVVIDCQPAFEPVDVATSE